jgi:hypothetical protein
LLRDASIDSSGTGGDVPPSSREMQIKQYDDGYDLGRLRESGYGHVLASESFEANEKGRPEAAFR